MAIEITQSSATPDQNTAKRPVFAAMLRGWSSQCPSCGNRTLFTSYLKVADECASCREELHHQRADDAPPYFTMFIVGHIIVAGVLAVEDTWAPPTWVHAVIWTPLIFIMSLWLLPRIKGALIGLQWANRMHGFSSEDDDPAAPEPEPQPTTG